MELEYTCPECGADMIPCQPFANSDVQLRVPRDLRAHKKSDSDIYGSATVVSGELVYECLEHGAYLSSLCRVKRYEQGKMAAAGDSLV